MTQALNAAALAGAIDSTIYVAVEVSRSSWVVALHCPDAGGKVSLHTMKPASTGELVRLIRRSRERVVRSSGRDARVLLTYEAGYEGFWLVRDIERRDAGIEVFLNDPASLQTTRRARKVKTDRVDARKMARSLKAWDQGDRDAMSWVRVPGVEEEDRKRLMRERDSLIKERVRLGNRIKALLMLHGIFCLHPDGRNFVDQLATVRTGYGAPLPPHLRAEIDRIFDRRQLVKSQLEMIERDKQARVKAGRLARNDGVKDAGTGNVVIADLVRICGIGPNDAALLADEVFYRDFKNRRELGSWAGLTSVPWASGGVAHDQGISKAGPGHLRKHLIQMAWRWLRYQPDSRITQWFHSYVAQEGNKKRRKKTAIVAVARKLLIALWRYVTLGLLPDGAITA